MHAGQFLGFAAVSLALALVPGPSWIYVISTTAQRGRRTGLVAVLGNATGIACHVLAVALGLAAVLSYSLAVYLTLKWIGAFYLIYLGLRTMLTSAATDTNQPERSPSSTLRVFGEGILVNLLNPKVALVMLALLPQFVDTTAGSIPTQLILIGLVHALIASVVLATIVLATAKVAAHLRGAPRVTQMFRAAAGLLLMAVGLRLGLSQS